MTISLNQQIEEIDYELRMRAGAYPRWVSAGKIRKSEAEFHVARLEAARATLRWLQDNEAKIKAALGERAA